MSLNFINILIPETSKTNLFYLYKNIRVDTIPKNKDMIAEK